MKHHLAALLVHFGDWSTIPLQFQVSPKNQIELAACAPEPGVREALANVLHSRAEINRSSKSFRMLKR